MTQKTIIEEWPEDDTEDDRYAARVVRDGKTLCMIILEYLPGDIVHAYREDRSQDFEIWVKEPRSGIQALRAADNYLDGFAAGFDEGVEYATEEANRRLDQQRAKWKRHDD